MVKRNECFSGRDTCFPENTPESYRIKYIAGSKQYCARDKQRLISYHIISPLQILYNYSITAENSYGDRIDGFFFHFRGKNRCRRQKV